MNVRDIYRQIMELATLMNVGLFWRAGIQVLTIKTFLALLIEIDTTVLENKWVYLERLATVEKYLHSILPKILKKI